MNTSHSASLFARAQRVMPGGVNSPVRAFRSVGGTPRFIDRAKGPRIWDVDGNEYIDLVMSWGPLILGHADERVVRAATAAAARGSSFGAPTEAEVRLAELVIERFPSMDMVRMVNSGTEATMSAIRVARAFTSRPKVLKFDGCWHGHADGLLVKTGSTGMQYGVPDSAGVPSAYDQETLVATYNDLDSVTGLVERHGDELAAIIVEPVAGNMGVVPPASGFLEGLRRIADTTGAVLIFDEVITGFRLALGGAQELFGIRPDLTTLGKIIGGGFPIGIFGGRRDLMEQVAPGGAIYQAGTFNGSTVPLACGMATLDVMERERVLEGLDRSGGRMRRGLQDIVQDMGLPYSVVGIASMFKLFFGSEPHDYGEALKCDRAGYFALFWRMLEKGVFLTPSQFETDFISAAHSPDTIDATLEAFSSCLKR